MQLTVNRVEKFGVGFCFTLVLSLFTVQWVRADYSNDLYPNFTELSKHHPEGIDFRVVREDRSSSFAVLAIHGGKIEPGSSDLARLIAGDDLNLYLFEGLLPQGNLRLHLTSHHFDEPRALDLVGHSRYCISVHGFFQEPNNEIACLGGGNAVLREALGRELRAAGLGIRVESPCARFEGLDANNIVNRCGEKGVQIEMSPKLRNHILSDATFARTLSLKIRDAIHNF